MKNLIKNSVILVSVVIATANCGLVFAQYDYGYDTGTSYSTYDTGSTYGNYNTGTTYGTYDTGTTYNTYNTGTTYPTYDTGSTYGTYNYNTGTTYPTYDTGTTYSTYQTGTTYPTYDTGTTYGTYDTGTTYPTYNTGTTYSSYDTGTTYPTYDTGTTYGTYDTGTTYPTYDTGTTYSSYDTGTTYPTYDTGTTYSNYDTGTTYPTYDTGTAYPIYDTGVYPIYDTGYTPYSTPYSPVTYGNNSTYNPFNYNNSNNGYSNYNGSSNYGYVNYINVNDGHISCSVGTALVSGSCVIIPTTCPAGTTMINGTCQINNIVCPTGTNLVNGSCQPIVINTCPTGTTMVNGVCQPIVVNNCPTGTTLVNGVCQPIVINTCPTGTTMVNGVCQPIVINHCPTGTVLIDGSCVQNNYGYYTPSTYNYPSIYTPPVISNYPTYGNNYSSPMMNYQTCFDGSIIPLGQSCYYGNNFAPVRPQTIKFNNVVTSIATQITNNSARCNGIGLIANGVNSTGWFEYGETPKLGRETSHSSIGNYATSPFSNVLSNLKTGNTYYCRAVMNNQYGTFKGEIVSFKAKVAKTVYVKPVATVKKTTTKKVSNVITCSDGSTITVKSDKTATVLNEGGKLIALTVEKEDGNISPNQEVNYKLSYKNSSDTKVYDVAVNIAVPPEFEILSVSAGTFDNNTHTISLNQASIPASSESAITWRVKVSKDAMIGKSIVTTGYIAYTISDENGKTVQDEVTAYSTASISPVSDTANSDTGSKNVVGEGYGFLPSTLVEWFALVAIICIIFILGRNIYVSYKNEQ